MIPGMMGQQNVPTTKELWKNEKTQYRPWMIILGVGLFIITSLYIASFILTLINKSEIIDEIEKEMLKDLAGSKAASRVPDNALSTFNRTYLIIPALIIFAMSAGIVLYIGTIFRAYKAKNFARLSGWPTLVVGMGAFMGFINIMMSVFKGNMNSTFNNYSSTFLFVNQILLLVIYFTASAPVSRVRRQFLISERMEQLKNNPQFQAQQEQFAAFMQGQTQGQGFPNAAAGAATKQAPPNNAETIKPAEAEVNPEKKRLEGMGLVKLKAIAKKLSISGYSTMKKDELIEAILRVSN